MGDRGRKSAASLAVASSGGVTVIERPVPPADLDPEERAEWMRLVNAYPADRFPEGCWADLAERCRQTVAQREIAQMIRDLKASGDFSILEYTRLRKMQTELSRSNSSLGVRLGFAYSTAYEKRPPKGGNKPNRLLGFSGSS